VSVRAKFEDVNEPRNRKWLYPYVGVVIFDAAGKQIKTAQVIYNVTNTDLETSMDDNWILFETEFTPPEEAAWLELRLNMYEQQGVRGTVYLDDVKIVQTFKD